MLAACARRKARHEEWGSLWRRLQTSLEQHLAHRGRRNRDAETLELADDPFVSPLRVLVGETKDQLAQRALERWSPGRPVRVCPAARDKLAVPAKQCLRLDRKDGPGWPGQRTAQRRQKNTISPRQLRSGGLPAQDRQLVPEHEDLQLLRATRPPQQPYQREHVPDNEIHKRPEQTSLPRPWQERRT
jgi:hypothetical protein